MRSRSTRLAASRIRWAISLSLASREDAALDSDDKTEISTLLTQSRRLEELGLNSGLSDEQRTAHLARDLSIAQRRFDSCQASVGNGALADLQAEWQSAEKFTGRHPPTPDAADIDALTKLIFDTEIETSHLCGTPTGDDSLLLLLANSTSGVH
jgi:hypothetical protein